MPPARTSGSEKPLTRKLTDPAGTIVVVLDGAGAAVVEEERTAEVDVVSRVWKELRSPVLHAPATSAAAATARAGPARTGWARLGSNQRPTDYESAALTD